MFRDGASQDTYQSRLWIIATLMLSGFLPAFTFVVGETFMVGTGASMLPVLSVTDFTFLHFIQELN